MGKFVRNRGVLISHLVAFALFISAGYLINRFLLIHPGKINHLCFLSGGFGVWLAYLYMTEMSSFRGHYRSGGWLKNTISIVGMFAILGLFMTGILMLMPWPTILPKAALGRIRVTMWIHLGLLTYSILCYLFIWTIYKVAEKNIVIVNGKVFYSGEKYRLWPIRQYQETVEEQEQKIVLEKFELICKDTRFRAVVSALVRLEINDARLRKVRVLDFEKFLAEVEVWLKRSVSSQALALTGGELMKGQMKPQKEVLRDFPISWDGKITVINA